MRRRLATVLALASLCVGIAAALIGPAEAEDVRRAPAGARYDLTLRLHDATRTLTGDERVSFVNARATSLRSAWFRLWANGLGSCSHRLIFMQVVAGGHRGRKAAACTAREVVLPRSLEHGQRTTVRLRFSVHVPAGNERFGHTPSGPSLLGNAIPILAVTDAHGTHLEPYSPLGEAGYSLAAEWHVSLDLASDLTAATTGTQSGVSAIGSQRKRLRFTTPHARDFELAIGPMHTQATTAGAVRIRFLDLLPEGSVADSLRSRALAAARADVLGYERRFGPYGAPELDVVQTPSMIGQGMEYPEIVFVEMTTATIGERSWAHFAALLAHEIAHQWFYGIVGDNQWREPWLDESFATFASGFPSHSCTPGDPLAGYPPSVRVTSSMGFFDREPADLYFGGLYGGGACALRDLRSGFGAARFDTFLRRWVASHRYGVATTSAFVHALRRAAPAGFDVSGFLRRSRIDVR